MKHKIPVSTKEQWEQFEKRVKEKDFPIKEHLAEIPYDGPALGFDRANSKEVDNLTE